MTLDRTIPKHILIVDDEELARQRIRRYLRQNAIAFTIEEAESGIAAIEKILAQPPDIIFLDVEMPGLSGFETLQQLPERNFQIVFQTAYDEFAVRAFEEQACDYLLKPFTLERFQQALTNALTRVANEEKLQALEARFAERAGPLQKFVVKQGARLRLIEESEVVCFVSRDHYTLAYFDDRREGISELSLSQLQTRLDPALFKQLHRNNIVNVEAMIAVSLTRSGGMEVELRNGMRLPVSRRHRQWLRQRFQELGE
ncbi:MAG: response regulator [Acidobacteria bacterium]|nr:response regulator [Acidobacteriota bacterium]